MKKEKTMEIQSITNFCLKCEEMKHILLKREQGITLSDKEIKKIRKVCANCRSLTNEGIYKADCIISALELQKQLEVKELELQKQLEVKEIPNRNVGKKAVLEKQHEQTIQFLMNQPSQRRKNKTMSSREIASIIGISKSKVYEIMQSIKEKDVQDS